MSDYQYDPGRREEPYTGYYRSDEKKQKKHTGLLAVLIVLAVLTAAASWAVNFLDLQARIGPDGLSLFFGNSKEPDKQELTDDPDPAEQPDSQPAEDSQVEPDVQEPDEPALRQEQSPPGVENITSDQKDALSLQAIYEKSIPSVASIICRLRNGSSTGTGIVMSADGYVITNYHVIDGAEEIQVLLEDDAHYDAELIGGDEPTDLAVLKIDTDDLMPAEFGNSDVLRVGDQVVAIGDPLGTNLRGTMTDGIVSAINRDLVIDGRHMTLIQTNAALNSGNSGGPLINCYGQVIGINTVKMIGGSASAEGLGFAIPINVAKPIIDELIERGYVSGRPAIGVEVAALDVRTQFFYNLPAGVIVTAVEAESDAERKGLSPDDIIVSYNGVRISTVEELEAAKEATASGDTVTVVIYRGGTYYEIPVLLMDQTRPELQ